jgi:hypothetical protein
MILQMNNTCSDKTLRNKKLERMKLPTLQSINQINSLNFKI